MLLFWFAIIPALPAETRGLNGIESARDRIAPGCEIGNALPPWKFKTTY